MNAEKLSRMFTGDVKQDIAKFITSYRKKNQTLDSRDLKASHCHPTQRTKKQRMKSINDNFLSLDSCKNSLRLGHVSHLTMKSREKSSVKKQKSKNKSFVIERKRLNTGGTVLPRQHKSPYKNLKIKYAIPTERKVRDPSDLLIMNERSCKSTMNKNNKKRKIDKLEIELARLKAENSSKEISIKMLTSQVDSLTQKLTSAEEKLKNLDEQYQKSQEELERLNKLASDIYSEYAILAKEKDSETMQADIDK